MPDHSRAHQPGSLTVEDVQVWKAVNDGHGLQADSHNPLEQVDDVARLLVLKRPVIGVVDDARRLVGSDVVAAAIDNATFNFIEALATGAINETDVLGRIDSDLAPMGSPRIVIMSLTGHALALLMMLAQAEGKPVTVVAREYRNLVHLAQLDADMRDDGQQ